ncbi:uncharacterized protein LOC107882634 [Acyrthosiphon pisum]|uniref:Uncharacterized protein n=1 Tax=Acyrthosiphon pisum TaxID=7029 RepID=A0A8R2D1G5_ACYPI|nr:uncharacterized protein LOC107882634 [Acyrthosiphon pisum]|eukprot:XP_016656739.1 PREDICTED: uncharacterized protein LOC107882634 [Acyrthosiphon pisum]
MKNQTIKIDFTAMLYIGIMYIGLVISGWLLMRLTIACFKLPSILNDAATAAELKERTSTTATTILSEEENEDSSFVQYFDTSTQGTCNDTNILQQPVMHYKLLLTIRFC